MYGSVDRVIARTRGDFETFGYADQTEFENAIQTSLEQASNEIERYTGRDFEEHTGFSETIYGNGRNVLSVTNIPVIQITEVAVAGDPLDASDYSLKQTPSNSNLNTGRIKREDRNRWVRNREYTFTYDWGYTNPPPGIDAIAEEMIVTQVNNDTAEITGGATQSESMDGYSVQYDIASAGDKATLTEDMQTRLDKYKNMAWG
jgi:hypothetical protein